VSDLPSGEPGHAAHHAARRSIERERDAAETSRDRFAYLAEASRCLASSLDYEATLTTAAGLALPYLGAWCIVDVITEGGGIPGIRRVAVLHPDPAKQAVARALHERYPPRPDDPVGAPRVMRRARPEVVSEVGDAALEEAAQDAEHLGLLRALGVGAYVIVPMVARGQVLGAITFVTTESGRRFGDLDVTLAEDLAARAALAVDNARLHGEALQGRKEAEVARAMAEAAQAQADEARVAAEAANRAKSEFLAVMSHELRTPLNAIGGYAELIELGVRGPVTPEQRADLARLQKSQRHLLGLINGVLNYSRVEAGAVQYAVREVPLGEVLAACEGMVAPQMRARRLTFAFGGCDPALTVRADEEKLQQIVLNLLTNAGKFTEPEGQVTLECAAAGIDTVAIRVTDSGHGIAPEQQARIFEPFVQVDARLVRMQEGVGLGLAISRDLARGMGGDLTVESRLGAGSTFTLLLPRGSAPGP
jgi:signal transduction histidine kinase